MRDEAALLQQLQEQPDDLDILLVYADLLDELGHAAGAEFLRLHRRLLDMRHGTRGLIGQSRLLLKLGKKLPADWLALVSRPWLPGTTWAGEPSTGQDYVFRYLPGGVLNYTSPSGTFQNGTWRQIGNHVDMETNCHFADWEGFIAGDRIRGSARNIRILPPEVRRLILGSDRIPGSADNISENKWRWDVTRTTDPKLCRRGRPVKTTDSGHPPRRRKWEPQMLVGPPTPARRRRSRGPGL